MADELLAHAPARRSSATPATTRTDSGRPCETRECGPSSAPSPSDRGSCRSSRELYGKRYLVECFFHNLKRFRAIATRFEKTARNFLALTQIACAWLWLAEN